MKITKKNNNKKLPLLIALASILFVLAAGASVYFIANQSNEPVDNTVIEDYNRNDVDLSPSTDEQQDAGSTIKNDALNKNDEPSAEYLTVTITAANQNDASLQIRTTLDAISSDGNCTLKLSGPSGKVVEKTAKTQALASNSTCQGFDVPVTELSPGNWKVTVSATMSNKSGSASQDIVIR